MRPASPIALVFVALALVAPPLAAQDSLSIDRIFREGDFRGASLPSVHWLRDGASYIEVRPDSAGGSDIVRVDLATGGATVLADAARLVDEAGERIEIEDFVLSEDETRALLFHDSERVWRSNTRGAYHVLDFGTGRLVPLVGVTTPTGRPSERTDTMEAPFLGKNPSFLKGGLQSAVADPDLQMFAKFSPDGSKVAFVRGNNLWVTDLATGQARQLTRDGSSDIINGTTDWVYEEELGLADAFRWSPDGRRIAFWRFDQSPIRSFPMVDELDTYPEVSVLRYPKAGFPNSRVRVGVLDLAGAETRWLQVGPDTGQYIARMEWMGRDSLVVQRLPRSQNRLDLLMVSASTGIGRTVLSDRDSAYVDVDEGPIWINDGKQFLWLSDRSGWRQVYLYDRSGRLVRQVTRDGSDVLGIAGVDERRGQVYVTAAAPDPTQRQVFRYGLRGGAGERVTREGGTHNLEIGPGARFAVDYHSSAGQPTTVTLHQLPSMRQVRVLEDNAELKRTLAALDASEPEFFRVPGADGTPLDAYRIVPPGFDSTRAYPVLMYAYGGPASPQVNDAWGGSRYLWHQLLAQKGYVVVVVDNRGAAWRGRDFRKMTQKQLGTFEARDQIAAARWLGGQPWVDGDRIGLWGWSYGGYLTSLALGLGGDVFDTGIAVAPVTDWQLYDTIYTERFMGLPRENPEGYRESAPIRHVEGITADFLLIHGTGDDNVHPQNSLQLAHALQEAGKPFRMMLYPNKTHSISGANTQAHLFGMMTRFVLDNL